MAFSPSLRKFCLCFPARFGALFMTTVSCCIGCILIGFDWVDVSETMNRPSISHAEKGSLVASALVLTIVTVVSVIGFIAALKRSLRFLVPYSYAIMGLTLLSIIIGSFYLAVLFGSDAEQRDINDCVTGVIGGGPAAGNNVSMCTELYKIGRTVMAVTLVIYWLILAYNAYISWIYTIELKHTLKMTGTTHPPSPSPAMSIFGPMPDAEDDVLDEKLRPRMPGTLVEDTQVQHAPELPRRPQAQPPQPPPPKESQPEQSKTNAESREPHEPDWLYAPVPPPPRIGAPPTPEARRMNRQRARTRSDSGSSARSPSQESVRTLVDASSSKTDEQSKPQQKSRVDPFANPFPVPKMGSNDMV